MAIRKRTIRKMSPVARKLARFVNEFQSTTRRLKYLLSDIQDLELVVAAQRFYEKEMKDVQPEDTGRPHPKNLSSGKRRQSRHDQVGQPGDRRGSTSGHRRKRPRNKRKKFQKGAKAL